MTSVAGYNDLSERSIIAAATAEDDAQAFEKVIKKQERGKHFLIVNGMAAKGPVKTTESHDEHLQRLISEQHERSLISAIKPSDSHCKAIEVLASSQDNTHEESFFKLARRQRQQHINGNQRSR